VPEAGNPRDLNRYTYARNSPVLYADPSGHIACLDEECNWVENPVTGEIAWQGPSSGDLQAWQTEVLVNLLNAGPVSQHAAQHIMDNEVEFTFGRQLASGAAWTLASNIQLNSKNYSLQTTSTDHAWMLSLIVHEVKHLEQGAPFSGVPLSVEGELEAWQTQYQAMVELGHAPAPKTHFYRGKDSGYAFRNHLVTRSEPACFWTCQIVIGF